MARRRPDKMPKRKKTAQISSKPVQAPTDTTPNNPTILPLLRSAAGPAFFMGGFGMISSNYWVGVALVYIGIFICFVECCLEPWMLRRSHWYWLIVMSVLISITTIFTISIPLSLAPIKVVASTDSAVYPEGMEIAGIKWIPEYTKLRVGLINTTRDTDYKDIDFTIEPDKPIAKIGQLSSVPGVSFLGDIGKDTVDIGGRLVTHAELIIKFSDNSVRNIPVNQLLARSYRVRCESIPRGSSLELVLAIAEPKISGFLGKSRIVEYDLGFGGRQNIYKRAIPTKLRINGTYTASYRQRYLDEIVNIKNFN
ncbi:MAG: hypothetical protein WDA71_08340 [Actinomycetota bacterium]